MTTPSPRSLAPATLATAVCFVLPLGLYASTAAHTIQGGDTGEFGVIGLLGGVAHPPGYPLFCALARVAGAIPFGAPFFRIALVSALCGAAAVAVLQRTLFRITGHVAASTLAALAFALSQQQWRLAGVPEVFALNALAAALIFYFAQRLSAASPEAQGRESLLLGLAGGLALSNHHSAVWCLPLAVWPFIVIGRRDRAALPRLIVRTVLGGLLGLTPYLLLPIFARTAGPSAIVWGHVDTWGGFVTHFLRREFGTLKLGHDGEAGVLHLRPMLTFLEALPHDYVYLPVVIGLLGLIQALRRRTPWALAAFASWLLAGPFFTALFNAYDDPISRSIQERFYVLPELLFAPFIAAGIVWLEEKLQRGAVVLAGLAIVLAAFINVSSVTWRGDSFIERNIVALLRGAAPNATIVGRGDTGFWAMRWAQHVLHERPDVHYIDFSLLRRPWYEPVLRREAPEYPGHAVVQEQLGRTLSAITSQRPTYVTWSLEDDTRKVAPIQLEGLLYRVVPPGTPPLPPQEQEKRLLEAMTVIGDQPEEPIEQQNAVIRLSVAIAWMDLARQFADANDIPSAERCRARSLYLTPKGGVGAEVFREVEEK